MDYMERLRAEQSAQLGTKLICGHLVILDAYPDSYFVECPWCPASEWRAIVTIDGRTV